MTVYFSEVLEFALNQAENYRDDYSDQIDLIALEEYTVKHFGLSRVEVNDRDLCFFIRKALEHNGMEIKS